MSETTRTLIARRTWRYGWVAVVGLVCLTAALQSVRGQGQSRGKDAPEQAAGPGARLQAVVGQQVAPVKTESEPVAIDPGLERILAETPADQPVSVLVFLSEQVDLEAVTTRMNAQRATLRERHETVVRALQEKADTTQGGLLTRLNALQRDGRIEEFQPFWVANSVRVDAAKDVIVELAARPDVGMIYFNYPIETIEPIGEPADEDNGTRGGPEPGLIAVRAPEVWAMGYTGEGVLVATLDTGVDGNHPALASRWRGVADPRYAGNPGWAWFDPVTNTTFPRAWGSHGTHTMGTVCGGAPGDQVGVAPGAQWIHAGVIDRQSIQRTIADAKLAFQWMLDPDGDPSTNWDVPAVCSNSWRLASYHGYPPCWGDFWSYLDACEAAGIVILFSAGNEGPGAQTIGRPPDRATTEYMCSAVGAVDAQNPNPPWAVAGFSSRGPSYCTPDGGMAIKPETAAPGVNVRSSVPGGGYQGGWSGTSMASPHVNGVVALIRQACPDLSVQEVLQILYDTATDQGPAGKDNSYGYGMVDAYEAVVLALSMCPSGETVLPEDFTVLRGVLVSGGLEDLFDSDDSRLVVDGGLTVTWDEPPVWVVVEGTAGMASPSGLSFTLEAYANTPSVTQKIALFNFNTQSYEEVDSRHAGTSDTVVEVDVSGDPSRFIDPGTLGMKARLTWKAAGPTLMWPWTVRIDQTVWTVVE